MKRGKRTQAIQQRTGASVLGASRLSVGLTCRCVNRPGLGVQEVGRDEWKKEAGYHRRSLAETAMMRLKTIFSDRLKSREWRRQETELRVRCAAMNKMTSLGMPQSYAT